MSLGLAAIAPKAPPAARLEAPPCVAWFSVRRDGGTKRGMVVVIVAAIPLLLTACSTPRIIAGDSTNQTFYLKQRVATF
jgi:hypothetical protein